MMNDAARQGTVGILPVGALGVAFYYHLTHELAARDAPVWFVERAGSRSGETLRNCPALCLETNGRVQHVATAKICRAGLLACAAAGTLPELLLVCVQSDQVLPVITNYVELIEWLHEKHGLDAALDELPLLVLSSNGIYHQRVRGYLVETLEESTLYGRLPDLWSEPMGRIVGKLLRGVTMQTGQRHGRGASAVYHPGPPGRTRVSGGDLVHRRRACEILSVLGGHFEVAEKDSATRVEFDKAMVNLFANLLGQFIAIDETGAFREVKVRDIVTATPDAAHELARHVVAVGRAVHAYRPDEKLETIYEAAMSIVHGAM